MKDEDKSLVSEEEIQSELSELNGWTYDAEKRELTRVWSFEKFVPTMVFIRKLTEVMDTENHHSNLALDGRSKTLIVSITTFSENAVTRADLEFARIVDQLEF